MSLTPLDAISPIDGRYGIRTRALRKYFSEGALMGYRVRVEVEYFVSLVNIPLKGLENFPEDRIRDIRKIVVDFSTEDALSIKEIERITNHDVKAVEYFIKEKFDDIGLADYKEFIHFGLTSQDINNTAIPMSLKYAVERVYFPLLEKLITKIERLRRKWKSVPMLARTHGQVASPTTLGKELHVFGERILQQVKLLKNIPFSAKFGGATGNMNAHFVAYPTFDWHQFADEFVNKKLGLSRSFPTTQIEHYDHLAALFDAFKRINNIIIDLNRDFWAYISMDYFRQKIDENEVGSSAMPHKVNPIDFENSEGNMGIANAIFEHLSAKLPISRLQRDLTDSTVLRNIGVPVGHSVIGIQSTINGLDKLVLNSDKLSQDLDHNWAVVAEAIQTILRREGYPKPYEALKALTRTHKNITRDRIANFIDTLKVSDRVKGELKKISPSNYTGV